MMMKTEITNILRNKISKVYGITHTAINTNNGILNEQVLRREKKEFLNVMLKNLGLHNELVKQTQSYPQNDISDVEFEVDMVIMKRKDYDKLLKYIENNE